ncbi:hypothetical protein BC830DRAFT_810713 [Chytriomyces sp. MP71]|nr:hypothetical protein BC830DRAFT_810713 [Chytriomyces sp. MP71]
MESSNLSDLLRRLQSTTDVNPLPAALSAPLPTHASAPASSVNHANLANPVNSSIAPSIDLNALKALAASLNATAAPNSVPVLQSSNNNVLPSAPIGVNAQLDSLSALFNKTQQPQQTHFVSHNHESNNFINAIDAIPSLASLSSLPSLHPLASTQHSLHQHQPQQPAFVEPRFSSVLLRKLADLCEDPRLLDALRKMRFAQSRVENACIEQRRRIQERHDKARQQSYADEIMGKDMAQVTRKMDADFRRDWEECDKYIHSQLMELVKKQQVELQSLKVPFFRVTLEKEELAMQKKILDILSDAVAII